MCILIHQPAGHSFSDEWLTDFYKKNSDGIGIMFADNKKLHVNKMVPKNVGDMIKFYRDIADGRECLIHLRMRTHGDIDLENCHPYEVFSSEDGYPLYMMHNGVLSSGNQKDTTKSDTWHYIRDIIQPSLKADPTQFTAPWFMNLVESNIGKGNKFGFMDAYGNIQILNKSSGVMWGDVWMSNTYAWDAAKAGVIKTHYYPSQYGGYGSYGIDDVWGYKGKPAHTQAQSTPSKKHVYADAVYLAEILDGGVPNSNETADDIKLATDLFFGMLEAKGYYVAKQSISRDKVEAACELCGVDAVFDVTDEIADAQVYSADIIAAFKPYCKDADGSAYVEVDIDEQDGEGKQAEEPSNVVPINGSMVTQAYDKLKVGLL